MTKSKILFYSCLSFVLGIFLSPFLFEKFLIRSIYIFILFSLFLILSVLFYQKNNLKEINSKSFKLWHFFILLMFFSLAFWRYSLSINLSEINFTKKYDKKNIVMQGIIISNPIYTNKNQSFVFNSIYQGVNHKIMIYANIYPEYEYGDNLKVSGELKISEKFNGFDFKKYLERFNIYSVFYYPEINILNRGRGNKIKALIYNFKNKIRLIIDQNLDGQSAVLTNACFLGDKKNIPDDLRINFARSGLSHIMAISGLHISIIILVFMNLFLYGGIKRGRALSLTILLLVFYLLLIAMPTSAVRAGIMGIIALLAINYGRTKDFLRILILAASIMLILNPRLLRDDIGFELSFLSVLGIILFFPLIDNFFKKIISLKFSNNIFLNSIFSIIFVTLSAQIFIWPILIKNFHQISLIAPISNLLVLWTLPFLIISIIVAIILSFIFPIFSLAFFVFPKIILNYIVFMAYFFSQHPLFYREIYYIPPLFLIVYFCIIFVIIVSRD